MIWLDLSSPNEAVAFVSERVPHFKPGADRRAIAVRRDGVLVAGVVFDAWSGRDCEVSIAGDGSGWAKPGILAGLFDYPFRQAGRDRLSAHIASSNVRACRFCARLGFRVEGIKWRWFANGDDLVMFGMFREHCRWLVKEAA